MVPAVCDFTASAQHCLIIDALTRQAGMELFGVTSHVRDVCDSLAPLGYVAFAPDLYHPVSTWTHDHPHQ